MLAQRSSAPELVDRPNGMAEEVGRGLWLCRVANHFLGGARVGRRFLQAELPRIPADRPVRVLGIGAGSCDIVTRHILHGRRRPSPTWAMP